MDEVCIEVVSDIFSERAATDISNFILSTAFERRQSISEKDALISDVIKPTELPKWLDSVGELGPYERLILRRVFLNSSNLLIFRSGTGSGKSSLLNYLKYYTSQPLRREYYYNILERPLKNIINILDFEQSENRFHLEVDEKSEKSLYLENMELFHHLIYDKLRNNFRSLITDPVEGVSHHYFHSVLMSTLDSHVHQTGLSLEVVMSLRRLIGIENDSLPEAAALKRFDDAVEKLEGSQRKIFAWLLIWVSASKRSIKNDLKIPLVMVIDNIDQIASYLQTSVNLLLQNFFADEYNRSSKIKILFMMRLATAADNILSMPSARLIRSHEAPSVVDILTVNLICFLLNPESVASYNNLEDEHSKELIYGAVYSYLLALLDPKGDLRPLLHGLSGTNLRLAQRHSVKWVAHPKNRIFPMNSVKRLHIQNELLSNIVPNAVTKIVHSVGRAITYELYDLTGEQIGVHLSPGDTFDYTATQDIAEKISWVLIHSRLLKHSKKEINSGKRSIVGTQVGEYIEEAIRTHSNEKQEPSSFSLKEHLASVFKTNFLFSEEKYKFHVEKLHHCMGENLMNMVSSNLRDQGFTPNNLVKHICSIVIGALDQIIRPTKQSNAYLKIKNPLMKIPSVNLDFSDPDTKSNRYTNASLILSPFLAGDDYDLEPVNLYFSKNQGGNYFPLYVLCRIREWRLDGSDRNSVTFDSLFDDANNLGFSESDLIAALKQFIRRDRRLIFSGIHDEVQGVESWAGNPNRLIRLTWAGYRYIEDVSICPPYLQWAFMRDNRMQSLYWHGQRKVEHIEDRFEFAFKGFSDIVNDEFDRISKFSKSSFEDPYGIEIAQRMLSNYMFLVKAPVFDCYIRSLPKFHEPILNSIIGIGSRYFDFSTGAKITTIVDKNSAVTLVRLTKLIIDWTSFARNLVENYRQLFGFIPEEWERIIEYCDYEQSSKLSKVSDKILSLLEK